MRTAPGPGRTPLERELPLHFHQPVANLDISDAEILILKHVLRKSLPSGGILDRQLEVVGVCVVERNQRMIEHIKGCKFKLQVPLSTHRDVLKQRDIVIHERRTRDKGQAVHAIRLRQRNAKRRGIHILMSLQTGLGVAWQRGHQLYIRSSQPDRKSTRLNSSHANISYAVFCLKKKK